MIWYIMVHKGLKNDFLPLFGPSEPQCGISRNICTCPGVKVKSTKMRVLGLPKLPRATSMCAYRPEVLLNYKKIRGVSPIWVKLRFKLPFYFRLP